jgi:hypothetical protein
LQSFLFEDEHLHVRYFRVNSIEQQGNLIGEIPSHVYGPRGLPYRGVSTLRCASELEHGQAL